MPSSFSSLIALTQALIDQPMLEELHLALFSTGVHAVTGEEVLHPEKALVLGPCAVLPQEHPSITCVSIDLVLPEPGSRRESQLVDQLIAEVAARTSGVVAYRRDKRWTRSFEPMRLDAPPGLALLRDSGVYLITGGLGGIGLELTTYLVEQVRARLVLVSRSGLPEREQWRDWLTSHSDADTDWRAIQRIQSLVDRGAEVLVLQADVTDAA